MVLYQRILLLEVNELDVICGKIDSLITTIQNLSRQNPRCHCFGFHGLTAVQPPRVSWLVCKCRSWGPTPNENATGTFAERGEHETCVTFTLPPVSSLQAPPLRPKQPRAVPPVVATLLAVPSAD